MLARRRSTFVIAAALTVLGAACKTTPPVDPAAAKVRNVAATDLRLRGSWMLQTFTPDTPLEPMLAAMLAFQFGQMIVRFDGQRSYADSPGVHVQRGYRITEVEGDQFKLVAFDDQGVSYQVNALFVGDTDLRFRSTTMPWKGEGHLRRTTETPVQNTQVKTTPP